MRTIIVLALVVGCRGPTPEPNVATSADESVHNPGAVVDSGGGVGTAETADPASPTTDGTDAAPTTEPAGPAVPSTDPGPGGPCPTDDTSGYFAPRGAPHPLACEVDADCRSGPGVNPEDGCCDTGVHNGVYGQAYLTWRAGWHRENCADAQCPVLPPPAPPRPCALQGRCCDGRCKNRCP